MQLGATCHRLVHGVRKQKPQKYELKRAALPAVPIEEEEDEGEHATRTNHANENNSHKLEAPAVPRRKPKPKPSFDNIIKINISGNLFEASAQTLARFPNSLLGNAIKREKYYNSLSDEYFFDRHSPSFDAILYFYQSGGYLYKPNDVDEVIFDKECRFFEILPKTFLEKELPKTTPMKMPQTLREKIYDFVDVGDTSMASRVFGIFSFGMILVSTAAFCLETVPDLQVNRGCAHQPSQPPTKSENGSTSASASVAVDPGLKCNADTFDPLFWLETLCIIWFTGELLIRFLTCPSKLDFAKQFMNWVDLLAILPYYISISIEVNKPGLQSLALLRVIRLVRVLRVFKLSRHSKGLQILGKTITTSVQELGLVVFFLLILVTVSGSIMYLADSGAEDTPLNSIPEACWFALVTLTTLGYGDVVPITTAGKIAAGACAVIGVMALALPVTVIVSSFRSHYDQEKDQVQRIDRAVRS